MHVEMVRSILAHIGVPEEALQCGAHPPFYRPAALALREAGSSPTAIHNNCSGKHAGMLALAKDLGAPLDSYLDQGHPAQLMIRDAMAALSGLAPDAIPIAVDGCSAPTYALPLGAAAGLYARLMDPELLAGPLRSACRRVVGAMRAHPEMVAGTDRICTFLMREGACDLIAKIGAEGFYGLGFRREGRGFGIALKVADGNDERARPAAVIECLRRLAILSDAAAAALALRFVGPLRNHRGTVVGQVVPVLDLRAIDQDGVPGGSPLRRRGNH
jgi:L-asparaginase II